MDLLGKEAKDIITGFKGIIVGKCIYLYGCNQYGIKPQELHSGKTIEVGWFDEGRILIIGSGVTAEEVKGEKNGGPNMDAPTEHSRG